MEQLSDNIFEVTINEGATIDEKCAEEARIFWHDLRKEPYGILVNNKNQFSYSFMGAQKIGLWAIDWIAGRKRYAILYVAVALLLGGGLWGAKESGFRTDARMRRNLERQVIAIAATIPVDEVLALSFTEADQDRLGVHAVASAGPALAKGRLGPLPTRRAASATRRYGRRGGLSRAGRRPRRPRAAAFLRPAFLRPAFLPSR